MAERALPRLAAFFGLEEVALLTLRVVKYVAGSACAGLPLHSDGSAVSFVCSLNACAGGGTYVRTLKRVLKPAAGHALFFCGRWLHAGVPVAAPARSSGGGGDSARPPHPPPPLPPLTP